MGAAGPSVANLPDGDYEIEVELFDGVGSSGREWWTMADLTNKLEAEYVHDVRLAAVTDACLQGCGALDRPRPTRFAPRAGDLAHESARPYQYPCSAEDDAFIRELTSPPCAWPRRIARDLRVLARVPLPAECRLCTSAQGWVNQALAIERRDGIGAARCAKGYADCGLCCDVSSLCMCGGDCKNHTWIPEWRERGCSYAVVPGSDVEICGELPPEEVFSQHNTVIITNM